MNFQQIKEKISLRIKEQKFRVSVFGSNPTSDWVLIILIFIITLFFLIFGCYSYYQNSLDSIKKTNTSKYQNMDSKSDEIINFMEIYQIRQDNFDRHLNARE